MAFNLSKIVILRHAEKPGDAADESGGPDLSVQGYCRAAALAPALPDRFGRPAFIFAARTSAASNRPVETVTPLVHALSPLALDERFSDKDYAALVAEVLQGGPYAGSLIVICWHHGKIPDLARALGVNPPQDPWPPDAFDRYWVITPAPDGTPQIENLPQRLMFGDDAD